MMYRARLMDEAGATREFEFEADNNALASHHVAQVADHRSMVEMTWAPDKIVGQIRKAWFRRHYADNWIKSVNF